MADAEFIFDFWLQRRICQDRSSAESAKSGEFVFFIALKLKLESWCDGAMAELYSGSANTFSGTWANRNLIVCRGFQVLIISSSVRLDILTHNTRQEYRQK